MHGGAAGIGAPFGQRNGAYRHGLRTHAAVAERKALAVLLRHAREAIEAVGVGED